jgi:hypothetical protein
MGLSTFLNGQITRQSLKVNPVDGRQNGATLYSIRLFEHYLGWSAVKEYNAVKKSVTLF